MTLGAHRPYQDPEKVARTIWVGNLSDSVTEEELAGHFAECGKVTAVRLPNLHLSRPGQLVQGWVEFRKVVLAERALDYETTMLGGRRIYVKASKCAILSEAEMRSARDTAPHLEARNNTAGANRQQEGHDMHAVPRRPAVQSGDPTARTVYVKNLSRRVSERDVAKHFEDCGEVALVRMPAAKGGAQSKEAWVEFRSCAEAELALRQHDKTLGSRRIQQATRQPAWQVAVGQAELMYHAGGALRAKDPRAVPDRSFVSGAVLSSHTGTRPEQVGTPNGPQELAYKLVEQPQSEPKPMRQYQLKLKWRDQGDHVAQRAQPTQHGSQDCEVQQCHIPRD
ncbi:hypothetical protein WJX72_000801 [[Myrmecia] bisecta]|uniref:RRM domain-containing protein n=1 Tax=[Myrmecia] bisecta TaxID=41462 RepID=A0AAW1PFV7_9CHLO